MLGTQVNDVEVSIALLTNLLGTDFDIYTLDTRGNGRSTRLGCAASQAEAPGSASGIEIDSAEWKECYQAFDNQWGTDKEFFSSKAAAIDVAKLIQLINTNQETYVFGVGFGTLFVSRLMRYIEQKNLKIVKAVAMDSIISTQGQFGYGGIFTVTESDEVSNDIGLKFLDLCKDNSTLCAQKFGDVEPTVYFRNTIQSVYVNNTCKSVKDALPESELKSILAFLMYRTETRVFVPALLYRLNRCDEDLDVATILHVRDFYVAKMKSFTSLTTEPMESPVGITNLVFAELYNTQVTVEQLSEEYNKTIEIGTGRSIMWAQRLQTTQWKPYTLDAYYYNNTFTATVPTLLINGELDPETPLWSAQAQANNIQGSRSLVVLPKSGHMTFFDSPFINGTIPCGMQILINFLNNPDLNTVDTSCAKNIYFNFSGEASVNEAVMGVSDIYEDAYEAPEVEKVVSLYLFIGVEAGTVVLSIIIICCLIYYIVQLKDKEQAQYEDLDQ